jgi:hypothetical protein
MNGRRIERSQSPWLAGALPALRRARKRAEETARETHTALVIVKDGKVTRVRPKTSARRRPY